MNASKKFKLNAVCLAVFSVLGASANAQNAAEDEKKIAEASAEQEQIEVIEVTGLRGSLIKSINDKRFSSNVVDTINAEDIGKSTDQNIADALGRITGVSIVQNQGEGSQITIRGATSQQNNITLNGQQLATTDFSQAVDLSSFSADALSRLEVVKTPSADHDEGSLGGSVNLVTIKPLNRADKDPIRALEVQGRYNEFADETDSKVQFTVTETFLDDSLGLALSAYKDSSSTRRDQYRVGDFIESSAYPSATDQNGDVISDVIAIKHENTSYSLHQDESERAGLTLGLQWIPTDQTEITYDLTYSEQDRHRTFDEIKTRNNISPGLIEGERNVANYATEEYESQFTDPFANWFTVDTTTNTVIKDISRFGAGDISRSNTDTEESNLSTTLKIEHYITDDLQVSLSLGHSRSESQSGPDNAYTNMQNFHQVPGPLLFNAGRDIIPSGYDCTTGQCEIITGDTFVDLGENIFAYTDEEGIARSQWYDNTNVLTGFNPADLDTFHLGFISQTDVAVKDTINNAQLDFDWSVELGPITKFEFGAKVSQREKFVDNQNYQFTSTSQTIVLEDPETGQLTVIDNGDISGIRGSLIARSEGLGVDDFMESLGYDQNHITAGLSPIDVRKALSLIHGNDNVVRDVNDTETRSTDLDTKAVYFKANFEFLDGALTGDVGMRYVETEVEAKGAAGAQWWSHTGTNLAREFSYTKLEELRDKSLSACPIPDPSDNGYAKKFGRVDGLGWDTSAGPDPSGWTRIPDAGPCHDPDYADWFEIVSADPNADAFPAGHAREGEEFTAPTWTSMWRYADISGTHYDEFGDPSLTTAPVTWDGSTPTANSTVGFFADSVRSNRVSSFAASGTNKYTNFLPSLNLNYAITDDLVGRFAISKTMTRPEIDQLRPGFSLNQGAYWSGEDSNVGSSITQFNTKLKPLESRNLDLSLEWYFNPTSMLSVAFYQKDMSNFADTESFRSNVRDFREDETVDADTIYLDAADTGSCLSLSGTADFPFNKALAPTLSSDPNLLCDEYNVAKFINGDGAKINGIEIGYSQTYDFLPGFLSGLGISANYTYQDSKYDAQLSEVTGLALPEYPVADTPKHSYNFTTFWEQDGHQIRLSYRGTSDSLVGRDWNTSQNGRTWNQGSIWNEGRDSLDLSASYKVNDNVTISLQAVNLTDAAFRTYFTSRTLRVDRVAADNAAGYTYEPYDEGNPLNGEATKSRTYTKFKVGTTYRLGVRVNF
ncbi:TonB-dependent receptor [Colwellia sp. UCD-KL20]|uniref:TonB-dependent receptor domain-containing protein n=1 Tax=Colwellia sp. UCD-KL20 TaxID=1917165 RepID=UPI00256FBF3A|nr:TonB-dependent receptor [Colwellia sp. UCD-KL20]